MLTEGLIWAFVAFWAFMYVIVAMLGAVAISDGWDNASTRLRVLSVALAVVWPISLFIACVVGLCAGLYVLWFRRRPPC